MLTTYRQERPVMVYHVKLCQSSLYPYITRIPVDAIVWVINSLHQPHSIMCKPIYSYIMCVYIYTHINIYIYIYTYSMCISIFSFVPVFNCINCTRPYVDRFYVRCTMAYKYSVPPHYCTQITSLYIPFLWSHCSLVIQQKFSNTQRFIINF